MLDKVPLLKKATLEKSIRKKSIQKKAVSKKAVSKREGPTDDEIDGALKAYKAYRSKTSKGGILSKSELKETLPMLTKNFTSGSWL